MYLKLCLVTIFLLDFTEGAMPLSAETRRSLLKNLNGKTLEERRDRMQNLGALFFGSGIPQVTPTPIKEPILDPDQEPDIDKINEDQGVAEYLFQSDIDLSDEQLETIERSILTGGGNRPKRQVAVGAGLWTNRIVYYYFDASIDARKKSVVQIALNYIRARTCINFVESATAPNRIRVFSGSGCYSKIGMTGGVQDLSLGNGCDQVGITAHEFTHALGVWHMQMRDDRDDYITIDLTNVPVNQRGNFVKVSSAEVINYNPYEYGSNMHYGSNTFTTSGNSMIPLERRFLRTLGSRVISFYDIKTLNDHYQCLDQCDVPPAACTNGGQPNPRNCASCLCPGGYGGALCNQRPAGCGETLAATTAWKSKQFTFGSTTVTTVRDTFTLCNHWITAPAGRKIQIRVTFIKDPKCQTGCRLNAIEPKIKPNKMLTNARICCEDMLNNILVSELNPTPIVSYSRFRTATFTFQYRYV